MTRLLATLLARLLLMFELTDPTTALLVSVTNRAEKRGDDKDATQAFLSQHGSAVV